MAAPVPVPLEKSLTKTQVKIFDGFVCTIVSLIPKVSARFSITLYGGEYPLDVVSMEMVQPDYDLWVNDEYLIHWINVQLQNMFPSN
jgi:hypothetical protein